MRRTSRDGDRAAPRPWLLVGLGNPGPRYEGTRHNVGTDALTRLAADLGERLRKARRVGGLAAEVRVGPGGPRAVLLLPDAYMNRSGQPVRRAADWHGVPVEQVVVLHDDLDLDLGTVRLKLDGGHGGHNGLRDVERHLGSRGFHRVRLGIGRPPASADPADWVLARFAPRERDEAELLAARGADAARDLVVDGLETAQNRHHAR